MFYFKTTINLDRVNFLVSQIISRSSSGQERYVNGWGTEQYYWNDITSLIHLYTKQLKDIILKIHKTTSSSDADIVAERKAREIAEARALEAERKTQTILQEANEKMRSSEEVAEYRSETRQVRAYFQEECANLRKKLANAQNELSSAKNELAALKSKRNEAQGSHLFSQSSGTFTEQEKQTVQDIIVSTLKLSKPLGDRTRDIRDSINSKLGKEWGVVVGLSNDLGWGAQYLWSRWMIFKSNKTTVFVWQQSVPLPPPPPAETEYQFVKQYGDISQDDQLFIQISINTTMNSTDTKINKAVNIREILNAQLTKGWGVIVGLQLGNWSGSYSYDKWLYYSSNKGSVFIWYKAEQQAIQPQHKEEPKLNQTQEKTKQVQKVEKEEEQPLFDGIFNQAPESLEDDYVNTAKGGEVSRQEEVYIEVLLEKLMLPNQDPYERASWVEDMVGKRYGDKWGIIVNAPLHAWAQRQKYHKWYIYECKHANILVWSNKEQPKISQVQTTEEIEKKQGEEHQQP